MIDQKEVEQQLEEAFAEIGKIIQEEIDKEVVEMIVKQIKRKLVEDYDRAMGIL